MNIQRIASALAAGFILIVGSSSAKAQQFPPGGFYIDSMQFVCGPAVWTFIVPNLGDGARAIPGSPLTGTPPGIYFDAAIYSGMPSAVRRFFYAHECGHFVHGPDENMADCWAAQMGRRQGWFVPSDMNYLVQIFQWNPGDWTHAPGPARLQNIWNCYNTP